MSENDDQAKSLSGGTDTAGPYGFTRREIVALLIAAAILGSIALWTWWGRHRATTSRYWTVEDVVVDTLLLAKTETARPDTGFEPAVINEDAGHVLIDINTAGVQALTRLPGIGPVLARRVIEARRTGGRFVSLEDLQRVRGIGASTAADLEGWVRFSTLPDTTVVSEGSTP